MGVRGATPRFRLANFVLQLLLLTETAISVSDPDSSSEEPDSTMKYAATFTALTAGSLVLANATQGVPDQAQVIDRKQINVMEQVLPQGVSNQSTPYVPAGTTAESLKAKPFHIYDPEFLDIIGDNPTLTLIHKTAKDPIFHEAATWYPAKDEMFFCQNAGAPDAGTGLKKSSVVEKISLADAAEVAKAGTGQVNVTVLSEDPKIINPNGGTNYKGQILFVDEGQGAHIAPALRLMNPEAPYNTTTVLNNFFGRQFNSLNDILVNPKNKDIYFTDTGYGYLQFFRPEPGLPNQVYRFNMESGALSVVADGFVLPNGLTFSPDGNKAYITDTGSAQGLITTNQTYPASIYSFDVEEDGTFGNRKTFAFSGRGIPDGIHCDTKGNVYAGTGEGIDVWNPAGKYLGMIYVGTTSANFNFAGDGRMVILAETELYYVTLAAVGAECHDEDDEC